MFSSCLFSFSLNSSRWWLVVFGFVNTHAQNPQPPPFSSSSSCCGIQCHSSPAALLFGESAGQKALQRRIQQELWTKTGWLLSPPLLSEASPALPYPPPPHLLSELCTCCDSSARWGESSGLIAVFSADPSCGAIRTSVYSFDWIATLLCIPLPLSPSL